ncbi:MAG TPA: hypothetical protein VJL59_10205, partial [Anaerolineales bacterium]|nr:hypothetical protein [Anaerolineales bacterium]
LFQQVAPLRVLPGTALCGERTFLGISRCRDRPAHLSTIFMITRNRPFVLFSDTIVSLLVQKESQR